MLALQKSQFKIDNNEQPQNLCNRIKQTKDKNEKQIQHMLEAFTRKLTENDNPYLKNTSSPLHHHILRKPRMIILL